ncbi:hypothetical protein [Flavihumibacter fluvii]|uniref:hypothetical protein n=1 Tax=Flavihumibacter fluvii TaxID=2838157 RepID=UPI001BDF2E70|nr:hypothetical protein [Flavihumibacter fluvii]ULQ52158.1 hypothetical protein KJS93_18875 [Flavihumibacter fluvii]
MVSLEEKLTYNVRINESPKLTAFNNLLLRKAIRQSEVDDIKEVDEIYYAIVNAIHTNDKILFETYFNKKNKSNPSKESPSPFVNDDFLIFCLIVGILKFGCDKSWIKNIISLRGRNIFTITLENIINENFYSTSNLPEIVLMFFKLNNQALITNEFLTTTFKSISDNVTLFESKSDFHILCSLRSYDLIIELKESNDGSEVNLLKMFNLKFLARTKVITWFVQTTILILLLYWIFKTISINPEIKNTFDKIGSVMKVLSLFGISQLGNFFPFIKRKLYEIMLRIFGYPKDLIKKLKNKDD